MQYAKTPYMDKLVELGVTGQMKTVADGFHPGSEVANMAVLGYDLPPYTRDGVYWKPPV